MVKQGFLNIFLKIYLYFIKIFSFFLKTKQLVRKPTIIDITNQYIEKNKNRFLDSFNKKNDIINISIEPEFYKKEEYKQLCFDESNNPIEKNWKRRILFENTPRGNIIMFYDAYKMGFAYYSDSYNLPYGLLNAVAMKYVMTFCCRDFFMDENILLKENLSPLIKIHIDEPEKPDYIKKTAIRSSINTIAGRHFVSKNKDSKPIEKEIITNRFICLGKTINFQFIQPINKDITRINGFKSNLLEHLSGETNLQKQVMNYKDFKSLRNRNIYLDK
jgi:hypothetical protein